jgi:cysteine-rich repeat protein
MAPPRAPRLLRRRIASIAGLALAAAASWGARSAADCGDSLIQPVEECDDGNLASGDGCDAGCRIEGPLTAPQQACVDAINRAALLGFAEGLRTGRRCALDIVNARTGPGFTGCLDERFSAHAAVVAARSDARRCARAGVTAATTFGYAGWGAGSAFVAIARSRALQLDLLGDPDALAPEAGRSAWRCQRAALFAGGRYLEALASEVASRIRERLSGPGPRAAFSSREIEAAAWDARRATSVARAALRAERRLERDCGAQDARPLLPGACADATDGTQLADCALRAARCRFCLGWNDVDRLQLDCGAWSGLASCGAEEWACGDGVAQPIEECDDGNTEDGDGCSQKCTLET